MYVRRTALAFTLALVAIASAGCGSDSSDDSVGAGDRSTATDAASAREAADELRINELQVIGTHNSFHVAGSPEELELLKALSPDEAEQRMYTHRPLTEQFEDQAIRQIELDIFADAEGGRYTDPVLRREAGLGPLVDEVPEMAEPGTKVFHEQDVGYRSVCPTLVRCLTELRAWSVANPDHVPVAVHLQFKDGALIFPVPDQVVPEPWTPEAMDALDAEIMSVFPPESVITPDDVRGDATTLEEVVLARGWPTLGESRGKVMFFMVNSDPYRSSYLEGHHGLLDRVMFTSALPGQSDAAYMNIDNPSFNAGQIKDLVRRGYLVRTRADEPGVEAVTGDTSRRDAALESGAHWIGTDYPGPDGARPQYGTDYVVEFEGGKAVRCNPVAASSDCQDEGLEP